jgi:hypothetical protein
MGITLLITVIFEKFDVAITGEERLDLFNRGYPGFVHLVDHPWMINQIPQKDLKFAVQAHNCLETQSELRLIPAQTTLDNAVYRRNQTYNLNYQIT